jgi:hypothetical protein
MVSSGSHLPAERRERRKKSEGERASREGEESEEQGAERGWFRQTEGTRTLTRRVSCPQEGAGAYQFLFHPVLPYMPQPLTCTSAGEQRSA